MDCRVADVAAIMEAWAPAVTAGEGDNTGLMAGLSCWPLSSVLITIDVNEAVLDYAVESGANLIVAHHPFIYRKLAAVTDTTEAGRLAIMAIERRIAVFAAHTNLDRALGGVNDALCDTLGLEDVRQASEGSIGRVARLTSSATLDCFAGLAKKALEAPAVRVTGRGDRPVSRVYIVSGAGRHDIEAAAASGADCMLTGEIGYHDGQAAQALSLAVVEAGHYHTERPVLYRIEKHLQSQFQRLQYRVRTGIYEQTTCPFHYLF